MQISKNMKKILFLIILQPQLKKKIKNYKKIYDVFFITENIQHIILNFKEK